MKREVAYRKLLEIALGEIERHLESYHHRVPPEVIDLIRKALTATPEELETIVKEAEGRLASRPYLPDSRSVPND